MGQFGSQANTFWQLLHADPGSSHWSVVTPQGVADNGGLVTAAGATAASDTVGFLPSQLLRFSPLSATTDAGRSWSPAFLPGALAARPNALASGPGGSLAIVAMAVLHHPSNSPRWSRLVTLAALKRLAPQCEATALDAVAVTSTGAPLVGAACTGHLGLFAVLDGKWRLEGAALPGDWSDANTTILRLQASTAQTTVLATATQKGHRALFALSQSGSGGWRASAPLLIGADSAVRATAVGFDGALSVLVGSKETQSVDEISPGGNWVGLPAPPAEPLGSPGSLRTQPPSARRHSTPSASWAGQLSTCSPSPPGVVSGSEPRRSKCRCRTAPPREADGHVRSARVPDPARGTVTYTRAMDGEIR